eukprot:COSAG05_NODE_16843_length_337_cov_1.042017_1_plen_53_part_10
MGGVLSRWVVFGPFKEVTTDSPVGAVPIWVFEPTSLKARMILHYITHGLALPC